MAHYRLFISEHNRMSLAYNPGWDMHLTNLTAWLETGTCETPEPSKDR